MSKPAFPRPFSGKEVTSPSQDGMSLLEFYAGLAMQAIIIGNKADSSVIGESDSVGLSKDAFVVAEAMVKEAEKRSQ